MGKKFLMAMVLIVFGISGLLFLTWPKSTAPVVAEQITQPTAIPEPTASPAIFVVHDGSPTFDLDVSVLQKFFDDEETLKGKLITIYLFDSDAFKLAPINFSAVHYSKDCPEKLNFFIDTFNMGTFGRKSDETYLLVFLPAPRFIELVTLHEICHIILNHQESSPLSDEIADQWAIKQHGLLNKRFIFEEGNGPNEKHPPEPFNLSEVFDKATNCQ